MCRTISLALPQYRFIYYKVLSPFGKEDMNIFLEYLNLFLDTVFPTLLPNLKSVCLTSSSINSEQKIRSVLIYRYKHGSLACAARLMTLVSAEGALRAPHLFQSTNFGCKYFYRTIPNLFGIQKMIGCMNIRYISLKVNLMLITQ